MRGYRIFVAIDEIAIMKFITSSSSTSTTSGASACVNLNDAFLRLHEIQTLKNSALRQIRNFSVWYLDDYFTGLVYWILNTLNQNIQINIWRKYA